MASRNPQSLIMLVTSPGVLGTAIRAARTGEGLSMGLMTLVLPVEYVQAVAGATGAR